MLEEEILDQKSFFSEALRTLEASWRSLPDKPEESPISTLRALWFFAAGHPRSVKLACEDELPVLSDHQEKKLAELIEMRIQGTPLAYITGRQEFMGMEFIASPNAMIPRKETEILGSAAQEIVNQIMQERGKVQLLDLCTGSGNLALFLAYSEPGCQVTGVDLSADALSLARQNAEFLGLSGRAEFIHGNLFQPFEGSHSERKFDLIVCNPPYISSGRVKEMPAEISNYEPEMAFDGGPFGLNIPWRLVNEAPLYLEEESWICFEVGLGQGKAMLHSLQRNPAYKTVQVHLEKHGEIRALSARTGPKTQELTSNLIQGEYHDK